MDGRGAVALRKISGSALPAGLGQLALRSAVLESAATAVGSVAGGLLAGLVALAWPSELGDSALYSEEQLRSMQRARSQMRLHIEQREDGTLMGYGFYTGNNAEWQMIDVVQFQRRGDQFVADLDEGVELIWTPAVDRGDTLGIPALEAAPQAPVIWIYPPTEKAAQILVNPIYPPQYRDFILVFPVGSGVRPLYVVVSVKAGHHKYHKAPNLKQITGFANLIKAKPMTPRQGGAGLRERWVEEKGRRIYEWDSQHGELEVYLASDGSHLGAFSHITGEQLKEPKKKEISENTCEGYMGLKVRLEWFDITTERLRGTEDSADLGNDYSALSELGLSAAEDINNGMFELRREWLPLIQARFSHEITPSESDYFIAFDYEDANE